MSTKLQPIWLGFLIFLLSLTISIINPQAVRAETISLADYQSWILETISRINGIRGLPEEQFKDELNNLANRWEQINEVSLPDGQTVEIDHSYLVSEFRREPADLDDLVGLLSSLDIAIRAWRESAYTSDDLEPLESILARSEFEWETPEPSPLGKWFEELINRIVEFFAGISGEAGIASSSILEIVLFTLGIIVFLIILLTAMRGIRAFFAPQAEVEQDLDQSETPVTAEGAIKKARAFSEDGDYRNAVRYLYLSSLMFLEERGVLRFDLSRTNREYINDFSHRPEVVGLLGEVIEVFDRVWYGYQPIDAKAYAEYLDHVEHLKNVS